MSAGTTQDAANGERPRCPFCRSTQTELFSLFGSQLLTEQWYCRTCHTPFEYIKDAEHDATARPAQRSTPGE